MESKKFYRHLKTNKPLHCLGVAFYLYTDELKIFFVFKLYFVFRYGTDHKSKEIAKRPYFSRYNILV